MENNKGLLLRVLLNRAHSSITPSLLQMLPIDEAEAVSRHAISSTNPEPIFHFKTHAIAKMHYSWVHSLLTSVTAVQRRAFISCLEQSQAKGVAKLFDENPPVPVHSPLLKSFYLDRLLPLLDLENHLPLEYIPQHPFKRLTEFSKVQLIEIIDLLAMYDLSHEIRRIVATKNLKDLYTCLTPRQQQFLRLCLHQKDKVVTTSLHLEKWNGNCKSLLRVLQQRGITRLAIALSGQHSALVWHIAHILDTGRGELLQKQVRQDEIPKISSAIALQLENVLNYMTEQVNRE